MKNLVVSRDRLLPWEDGDAYKTLHAAMLEEYDPQGPTERHLVEELAGCIWRMKRVALAESALHRVGMFDGLDIGGNNPVTHAIAHLGITALQATDKETAADLKDAKADRAMTEKALVILREGKGNAYEDALAALREDTQGWWASKLSDEDSYDETPDPDAEGLRSFLESEVIPDHDVTERKLEHRPMIRLQMYGETLDPKKHQILAQHESHLDRKFERTLALLLKLQNTPRTKGAHP